MWLHLFKFSDLLFRIQQLEKRDKKREKEVKLLVKAVQNLSERFDNFLTNLESRLDLSSDGGDYLQSQDSTNLPTELKTLENIKIANSQSKLHNMATHHSEVMQNSLTSTDNSSSINSISIPSFAVVSSVTNETVEHSQGHGGKVLSQSKPPIAINPSNSVIEPNHEHRVKLSSVSNFSKGQNINKTSESISANSKVAQPTDTHFGTSYQLQHDSDVSQKTSQDIRSPVVVSDIPSKNQTSNIQKTQVLKSQPALPTDSPDVENPDSSLVPNHGQKTYLAQSAGFNSGSATVGIVKPNFTQPKQKQQATSVTSTEHDDIDVNSEMKYVNLRYWKMEKLIAPQSPYADSQCLKTVLCIDISASMRTNNAWDQMTQFFREFMNASAVRENVTEEQTFAIATFGIQTKIVQKMTMDLNRLHQTFESLILGGPSPLYGGLYKALFAAEPVTPVRVAGMLIYPRVILISDGHATDPTLIQGPDVVEEEKMQMIMDSTCEVAKELALRKVRVYCVPVGNANLTLMEKIASITHGRIYSFKDGALLAKLTKHNEVILDHDENARKFSLAGMNERAHTSFNEVEHDRRVYEERANSEESLPKLGCRVRRGPDWNRGNEDGNRVGTVVGHPSDYWVNVVWDCNKAIRDYSYGARGNFEVVIIDDPRVLQFDEVIAVGCHVHRGKDWSNGNDDGGPGSTGVVLKVQEDGIVLVRWENRRKIYCNFGKDGKFAVEVCNPFDVQQLPELDTTPYLHSPDNPPKKNAVKKNKNA
ncbi:hypothetical protein ACJMK2_044602 [Sinanodonta woodiana]|uniref:Uncharacterized protein n=1 Tax=Sinanodonta woodiana TaxID=1069815 RepID=A0ABD3W3S2_SINWO